MGCFFLFLKIEILKVIVYVGELLRYLVNQPETHLDKKHSVRIAVGNGLRSNVWSRG